MRTTDVLIQAKTLFKVLEPNGWSLGLALGNVRHPAISTDANLIGDLYASVPAAEAFGQNQGKAFYQFGLRYWLVPDRVQIDTTYGNRAGFGTEQRWFSIGLRLLSASFLP